MIGTGSGAAVISANRKNAMKAWDNDNTNDNENSIQTATRSKKLPATIKSEKCCSCFYKKPRAGSHVSIGYNLTLILVLFVCSFEMFRPDLLYIANNIVKEKISGTNFNEVTSKKEWFTFLTSFVTQIIGSYNDYNNIGALKPTRPDYLPIRIQNVELLQTRRDGLPYCMDPLSETSLEKEEENNKLDLNIRNTFHKVNTFLGINCQQINKRTTEYFGKLKVPINATSYNMNNEKDFQHIDCPYYIDEHFKYNNPFQKITYADPDNSMNIIEGYKYRMVDFESLSAVQGIQKCNFLDFNTKSIHLNIMFFLPTMQQLGQLQLVASFSTTGYAVTSRKLTLLRLTTPTQDLASDAVRLIYSYLPAFIFVHKFVLNVLSVVGTLIAICRRGSRSICKRGSSTAPSTTPVEKEIILKCPILIDILFNLSVFCLMIIIMNYNVVIVMINNSLAKYGSQMRQLDQEMAQNVTSTLDENAIRMNMNDDLIPLAANGFDTIRGGKFFYVLISFITGFETFYYFMLSHDQGFATSPLTVLYSLNDVSYLMVTLMVILIALGGFVALVFDDPGFLSVSGKLVVKK
jgi:hypothetical protein